MNSQPIHDLHIHYGGAIPVQTVLEILQEDGHSFTFDELERHLTYKDDNGPYEFEKFLRKFDILNMVHWTEARIAKSTDAVVRLLASQGMDYAEIRFSISKYTEHLSISQRDVTLLMCQQMAEAGRKWGVRVAPILCVKYENERAHQAETLMLIDDAAVCDAVVGLDLVGDERFFNAKFYAPIFKEWKRAKKGLIAHVGESQTAENVRLAIVDMGCQRVSHGIKAAYDPDVMKLANDMNVAFDVALTSNLKTGVVDDLRQHPVKILVENGCTVTLGTDDPVILDTTIQNEFRIAKEVVGLTDSTLDVMRKAAVSRSFLR